MRWPVTWRSKGYIVNPVEIEGPDHRNVVEHTDCLEAILGECCSKPIKYIEIWIDTVTSAGPQPHCPPCVRCLLCPLTCLLKCALCIPICLFKMIGIGRLECFV